MSAKRANQPLAEVVSRWAILSDEQLLETDFLTTNPASLQNLRSEIPQSEEIPEVEFAYDTKVSTGRKVRCVHCKFDNHNRGFVLQYKDGTRVLVGGTCGKKRYGADFSRIERDFESARQRAIYLARRNLTLAAAPEFITELDNLIGSGALSSFGRIKRDFGKTMGPLARTLAELDGTGRLFLMSRARDFAAEVRRDDKWERLIQSSTLTELEELRRRGRDKEPKGPIYRDQETPFWTVLSSDFFRPSDAPDRVIQSLAARARSAIAALENAPPKTSDLRAFFRGMDDILDSMRNQMRRVGQPSQALSRENLAPIVEWARQRIDKSYQFDGLVISREDTSDRERVEFRVPLGIGSPDQTFIDKFEEATKGGYLVE